MEDFSSVTSMRLTNILTLLLLITVSSTSFPSQTAAIDLGVFDSVLNILNSSPELKELYDSVKKKTPELRSSVKEIYDSMKKKTPELSSGVREVFDSVKKKTPELSAGVKELFDLVKENARDLSSGKGSGLSSVVREIANRYLPDGQARFVAGCATLAAEEVFLKVFNIVPASLSQQLSTIKTLNETNYEDWKESLDMYLIINEKDLALREPKPQDLTDQSTAVERLYHKQWYDSNRICLTVMKYTIEKSIRQSILVKDIASKFLTAVG